MWPYPSSYKVRRLCRTPSCTDTPVTNYKGPSRPLESFLNPLEGHTPRLGTIRPEQIVTVLLTRCPWVWSAPLCPPKVQGRCHQSPPGDSAPVTHLSGSTQLPPWVVVRPRTPLDISSGLLLVLLTSRFYYVLPDINFFYLSPSDYSEVFQIIVLEPHVTVLRGVCRDGSFRRRGHSTNYFVNVFMRLFYYFN